MKDEMTDEPVLLTYEQAEQVAQFAMQRRYVPTQEDRRLTRPKFVPKGGFIVRADGSTEYDPDYWVQPGVITHTHVPVSAMRIDLGSVLDDFTVVDLATGAEVYGVMWVDDTTLEYATLRYPVVFTDGWGADIHKATAVRVDYVNKRIEVNTPPAHTAPVTIPPLRPSKQEEQGSTNRPCEECKQPGTCKRLDYCAAHRCAFGERAP